MQLNAKTNKKTRKFLTKNVKIYKLCHIYDIIVFMIYKKINIYLIPIYIKINHFKKSLWNNILKEFYLKNFICTNLNAIIQIKIRSKYLHFIISSRLFVRLSRFKLFASSRYDPYLMLNGDSFRLRSIAFAISA